MLNDRGPKEIFRPKCGMGFTICRFYFRIDFCLICAFSCIQLGIFPNKLFNYVIFCSSSINSTIVECRSQWTKVCKSFFFASSIQSIVLGKIILTEVKKPFPDQITLSWNVIPHACANAEGIYRHMVKHVVPPVVKQKCPSSRKSTTVMPSALLNVWRHLDMTSSVHRSGRSMCGKYLPTLGLG